MNPSQKHSNNRHHNWLIYKNYDYLLKKYTTYYSGTLYDLGSGESPYKMFFLKYAEKYIGVDWADSIHETRADIIADLNKSLPIESNVADTVVSISVLEHLCEPQTMLNESFRILKSGGHLILQVPFQWWVHEAPYDYFRYTPFGLKYLLSKAGFKEAEILPIGGYFVARILKANYFMAMKVNGKNPLQKILRILLIPIWYFNQWLAPFLDKLDRNKMNETVGYWVIAKKT
jgi:SAM-dependent methyltransferase